MTDETPQAAASQEEKPAPKPAPKKQEEVPSFLMSSSPHVRTRDSIESVMYTVAIALVPALIGSVVFFGFNAVRVTLSCVLGCLAFEAFCLWFTGKKDKDFRHSLFDGSAVLTGLLLAMNLPSGAPWWLCLAGSFVAMVIAKHVFGGLGANPFNPALVARVFLLIAWAQRMTTWPVPRFFPLTAVTDGLTAATPLGILGSATDPAEGLSLLKESFSLMDLFLGNVGGSLGETSALLLLVGGVFLIWRKIIRWEIPVFFIGTVFVLSGLAWWIKPETMASPVFHILAGGLFLGAFFMATDYVTSPMAPSGMVVFGVGCGLITFVIRFFGAFPEGVSFAIVIMNSLVPLIDRYFVPKRVGLETSGASTA